MSPEEFGVIGMNADEALGELGKLLSSREPQHVVASVNWDVLLPLYEAKRGRPFFANIAAQQSSIGSWSAEDARFVEKLKMSSPALRRQLLWDRISQEVAQVLGGDSSDPVPLRKGFFDMGMDSLMAVQLKTRLEAFVGARMPKTIVFDYPNIEALGDYLLSELFLDDRSTTSVNDPQAGPDSQTDRTEQAVDDRGLRNVTTEIEQLSEEEAIRMLTN